jgi:hypothetical protein
MLHNIRSYKSKISYFEKIDLTRYFLNDLRGGASFCEYQALESTKALINPSNFFLMSLSVGSCTF